MVALHHWLFSQVQMTRWGAIGGNEVSFGEIVSDRPDLQLW